MKSFCLQPTITKQKDNISLARSFTSCFLLHLPALLLFRKSGVFFNIQTIKIPGNVSNGPFVFSIPQGSLNAAPVSSCKEMRRSLA